MSYSIGDVVGKLTLVERLDAHSVRYMISEPKARWLCQCECGNMTAVTTSDLNRGHKTSCGCLLVDMCKARAKHNMRHTITYNSWLAMRARCGNENDKFYYLYGGKGIRVCDRWVNSFENFLSDMGERPSKDYTLDRVDSSKDYCPGNCRWATALEQGGNTSRIRWLVGFGETKSMAQWSRDLGINYGKLSYHVARGRSVEEAYARISS